MPVARGTLSALARAGLTPGIWRHWQAALWLSRAGLLGPGRAIRLVNKTRPGRRGELAAVHWQGLSMIRWHGRARPAPPSGSRRTTFPADWAGVHVAIGNSEAGAAAGGDPGTSLTARNLKRRWSHVAPLRRVMPSNLRTFQKKSVHRHLRLPLRCMCRTKKTNGLSPSH
jgi:hypothetical protein